MLADRQRRTGLALTSGGVALLIVAAALASVLIFRVADATDWVEHTYLVRGDVARLESALDGVEIAARDRVLTKAGDSQSAYAADRAAIDADVKALRELVADNPTQIDRLDQLRALTQARFRALDPLFQQVALTDPAPFDVGASGGLASIRALIDDFDGAERRLLVERQRTAIQLEKGLLAAIVFCLFSAATVSVAVTRTNWSYLTDLRAQADALKAESESRRKAEGLLLQVQKLETVGQLTAGIAHDFNNLLTIVLGNLDTARLRLQSGAAAERVAGAIETAAQGARRAATLTQRLLAFSRQQALAPRQLDLNKTVAAISEVLERSVGETVKLETVLAAGLWPAFADGHQVENAIVNLVVNARDAMPDGGRITLETANAHLDEAYAAQFGDVAAGQYVMMSVTDTGVGIASAILPKVFDPFFTTKAPGKGTGLGLAMIHGFVKQSRGHIRIYSELGQGTSVKIYLPRMTAALEPAAAPLVGADEGETPRAQTGEAVLLVEDDDGVREFAVAALEGLGYRVLPAREAAGALDLLRGAERIDLIFTDVVLPGGVNGRQLAEQARGLRPAAPVLYTTGYTRNAIVHGGRLDADVRLLGKPYTQDMLARAVRRLIDESRA